MRAPAHWTRYLVLLIAILVLSAITLTLSAQQRERAVESAVTKIFVQANPPDLVSPWQRIGVESSTGSGVIIDGQRILTNAHVIADAVSIEVKRAGKSLRSDATVEFVGHDCDLALLTVDDPRFFEDVRPVKLGRLPETESNVQAYGFPVGGETISVTSGILSRIEIGTYVHSLENLLLAQIDAPINAGNSGGPVVAAGRLVGIANQTLKEGENVGFMVPAPVIDHFLKDVADGRYDGFPRVGVEFQDLESPAQRRSLGLADEQTGALVTRIDHGSPGHGVFRSGDVLLQVDGHAVTNDLSIDWPGIGKVGFEQAFKSRQIGDPLPVTILRDGRVLELALILTSHQFLVPGRRPHDQPQYLIFGGLVFQPLSYDYFEYFEEVPSDLADHALYRNVVTDEKRQLILMQKVLPHKVNRGYQEYEDFVVDSVNGVTPRSMEHLAQIIDTAQGPWLRIVTEDVSVITLDLEQVRRSQAEILTNFGIASDRSADLRVEAGAMQARVR